MKKIKLKPCPFCGKKPKVKEDGVSLYIKCSNRYCFAGEHWVKNVITKDLIEAWNARY